MGPWASCLRSRTVGIIGQVLQRWLILYSPSALQGCHGHARRSQARGQGERKRNCPVCYLCEHTARGGGCGLGLMGPLSLRGSLCWVHQLQVQKVLLPGVPQIKKEEDKYWKKCLDDISLMLLPKDFSNVKKYFWVICLRLTSKCACLFSVRRRHTRRDLGEQSTGVEKLGWV